MHRMGLNNAFAEKVRNKKLYVANLSLFDVPGINQITPEIVLNL
jgi:hypothetical protein